MHYVVHSLFLFLNLFIWYEAICRHNFDLVTFFVSFINMILIGNNVQSERLAGFVLFLWCFIILIITHEYNDNIINHIGYDQYTRNIVLISEVSILLLILI